MFSLFTSLNFYSQVSSGYSFSSSSGTYTAITGGVNYNNFTNWSNSAYSGTLPNSTAGFLDDAVSSALLPIGFNFSYNGTTYTQFGICTNGWISLGGLPTTTNTTSPLGASTTNNLISALGADLIGRGSLLANRSNNSAVITITGGDINQISVGDKVSGSGIPTGATVVSKTATTVTISANATSNGTGFHFRFSKSNFGIRYETIGTAPNRTLVVQWTGWQRYTTTGVFGELYNFQIRLNETTNTISFVYDISGPISTTSTTYQIGLRGSSSSDYNNRSTTSNWSSTVAGSTNISTVTLTNTVKPTSGFSFTWTPIPPNCVSSPTSPTNNQTNVSLTPTLSWSSVAGATSYDVYFGNPLPVSPTINTSSTSYSTGTLLGTTTYSWKIVPKNSSGEASGCSTWSFTTLTPVDNDDPSNATTLVVNDPLGYKTFTNVNSSNTTTESSPDCASYNGEDVWFKVIVPSGITTLDFDTQTGGITDGGMSIYRGTIGSLTQIECDDDDGLDGLMPWIYREDFITGETIYVRFWEYSGGTTGTFKIFVSTPQSLPVELVNFSANCSEDGILITWQTASENNSSHFNLDRSINGIDWENIYTEQAAGNSTQLITYNFNDRKSIDGLNYYRLNQYDFDGVYEQFGPISINCLKSNDGYFSIFPNPSSNKFSVILNNKNLIGESTLMITNELGKIIYTKDLGVMSGINLYNIDKLEVTPGVYYISVINNNYTSGVLKQIIR